MQINRDSRSCNFSRYYLYLYHLISEHFILSHLVSYHYHYHIISYQYRSRRVNIIKLHRLQLPRTFDETVGFTCFQPSLHPRRSRKVTLPRTSARHSRTLTPEFAVESKGFGPGSLRKKGLRLWKETSHSAS